MTQQEERAHALFEKCVVMALEEEGRQTMKFAALRQKTRIKRGITDILIGLKQKGILSWKGELGPATEILLSYG